MYSKITKPKHNAKEMAKKVKNILKDRGYSHAFNDRDFFWFKHWTENMKFECERVERIADFFMRESVEPSDYAEYVF